MKILQFAAILAVVSSAHAQQLPPPASTDDPAKLKVTIGDLQKRIEQLQDQLDQTTANAQIQMGQCLQTVGQEKQELLQFKHPPEMPVHGATPPAPPEAVKLK